MRACSISKYVTGIAMLRRTGGVVTKRNSPARRSSNANAQKAPAPGESREAIMSTLKQLGELKAAGILTDAEFEAKKKELLAKL